MAAAGNDSRVPVTILTGFLGSGKTTLLNNILRSDEHKMRFAIIENEFGEVGIDEKILLDQPRVKDDSQEIVVAMNGCICCTVRQDLITTLKDLHKRVQDFDGVLIETTGLADPAPVAQTFFVDEFIEKNYRLDGILTVVDANNIIERLSEEKPEGVENESHEQVAFADRILLNKCDLIAGLKDDKKADNVGAQGDDGVNVDCTEVKPSEIVSSGQVLRKVPAGDKSIPLDNLPAETEAKLASIEAELRKVNPAAPIMRCSFSNIHPGKLLNIGAFDLKKVLEMDPEFLNIDGEHEHDDSVTSCSWAEKGLELNINRLQQWISLVVQKFGADLFRYKGILAIKGCKAKFIFQGVGMLFSGGFADEIEGARGATHWDEKEERECRFVFIGKNMKDHKEELLAQFKRATAEENLRYKVGDKVQCRTGAGWKDAVIVQQWHEGNPYQMKVEGTGTLVWGPLDSPQLIRNRS